MLSDQMVLSLTALAKGESPAINDD
jgi:hypothetical protein